MAEATCLHLSGIIEDSGPSISSKAMEYKLSTKLVSGERGSSTQESLLKEFSILETTQCRVLSPSRPREQRILF